MHLEVSKLLVEETSPHLKVIPVYDKINHAFERSDDDKKSIG
jgi:hypothetical protein